MKVNPNLTLIRGQQTSERKQVRTPTSDFSKLISRKKATPGQIVEVVSLENKRAVAEMPQNQHEVDKLLNTIKNQVASMTKDELKGLHGLEGLIHVIPTG